MHWTNLGLIFIAGLNIGMAFLIWLRNPKNKVNIWLACSVFFIGAWSFAIGMFRETTILSHALIWVRLDNIFGNLIIASFFFLSVFFPYQRRRIS